MYSVWQRNYFMKLITDNKEKKIKIEKYNPNMSGNTFFFCVTQWAKKDTSRWERNVSVSKNILRN